MLTVFTHWYCLQRQRSHEAEGDWSHCECGMVTSKPASHLLGSWHCCTAAGCYIQVNAVF